MSTNKNCEIKKIAVVVSDIRITGGLRTLVKFLVDEISKNSNFEVTIFSLASSSVDGSSSRLLSPSTWFSYPKLIQISFYGYNCFHIGANFVEFEWQRYFKRNVLSDVLKDFDIVQVVAGAPAIAFSVLKLGVPVILQVATLTIVERQSIFNKPFTLLNFIRYIVTHIINIIDNYCIRNVDYILVENAWMYKYCSKVRNNQFNNLILAPPGVDINLYTPSINRNLNTKKKYILSVGRFSDPRKNINFLLDCYINIFNKFEEPPQLILAGSSPPGDSFWKLVSENKLDKFVQYIQKPDENKLLDLYKNACCFALTSNEEGFGIVLIEAMACGIPVISTKCGGPEIIITDSLDGFLINIGDIQMFSDRLFHLCSNTDMNNKMGEFARFKAVQKFDSNIAAKQFINIYKNLHQD